MANHVRHLSIAWGMFVLALGFLATPAAARSEVPQKGDRVLVMPFIAERGADDGDARTLEDLFTTELGAQVQAEVVAGRDVGELLDVQAQREMLQCDSSACMGEVGQALDAGWMLTGRLSTLDGAPILAVRLIHAERGTAQRQLIRATSLGEIANAAPGAIARLLGGASTVHATREAAAPEPSSALPAIGQGLLGLSAVAVLAGTATSVSYLATVSSASSLGSDKEAAAELQQTVWMIAAPVAVVSAAVGIGLIAWPARPAEGG